MNKGMRNMLRLAVGLLLISNVAIAAGHRQSIVIGSTVSKTGRYAEPSLMIEKAFRIWAKEVNERGGLLGRRVRFILYDDNSDADQTRKLYVRLIEKDKVDFVFSPYSTPLTLAASDVSERHNMLMLAIAASGDKPWQKDARYLFQLYAPAKRQFIGLLDLMAKKNLKSLAVIYDETSDFNVDIFKGIKEWANLFKLKVVFQKGYSGGKASFPGLLKKIRSLNPNAVILSGYPPDSYELLRLLNRLNYRPPVLAMPIAPVHPDFQKRAGPIADRVFSPSQWEPDERVPFPGTRRFVKRFVAVEGHMPSFHAASAYSACQLFEKAVLATGSTSNQKIRDYISALDTVTVLGRFKVDPAGSQIGHNSFIIQWQEGKKEIVWPQKMKTAQPIF